MQADDACIELAREVLKKEICSGSVMEVLHSLQEHPSSGKQWMKMIDKILIDDLGFSTTTHDQCVCKRTDSEGTVTIPRQDDDFSLEPQTIPLLKESLSRSVNESNFNTRKTHQSRSLVLWKIATVWMSNNSMIRS